ncbi:hypothetical protein [Pararhodobacter sp.]|jgi:hypothetical protein|uniref:hypothetical protein n=1 Tax=Pararhodobacter sp. TaxID=2127056 RepID=UPI002FDE31A8
MSDIQLRNAATGLTLEKGEKVLTELRPDRGRYWRDHAILALLGMAGAGIVLWLLGSDHVAIGSLGAVLALGVRGLYLASEQLKSVWVLTDRRLVLPGGRSVMLLEVETVRKLMGDMQIITRTGDKHLLKHIADPDAMLALIGQARDRRAKRTRS